MQTSEEVREFGDEMIDAEDTGLFQQVFIELDVRKVVRLLRQKQCYPPQSYLGSYVIQEVIMWATHSVEWWREKGEEGMTAQHQRYLFLYTT